MREDMRETEKKILQNYRQETNESSRKNGKRTEEKRTKIEKSVKKAGGRPEKPKRS
jgi:hypothetical protein